MWSLWSDTLSVNVNFSSPPFLIEGQCYLWNKKTVKALFLALSDKTSYHSILMQLQKGKDFEKKRACGPGLSLILFSFILSCECLCVCLFVRDRECSVACRQALPLAAWCLYRPVLHSWAHVHLYCMLVCTFDHYETPYRINTGHPPPLPLPPPRTHIYRLADTQVWLCSTSSPPVLNCWLHSTADMANVN